MVRSKQFVGRSAVVIIVVTLGLGLIWQQGYSDASTNIHNCNLSAKMDDYKNSTWHNYLTYNRNPTLFVQQFVACMEAPKDACRILYFHVGKTGGTKMEAELGKMLLSAHNRRYANDAIPRSCCDDEMMARFEKDRERYCDLKVGSYQVDPTGFLKVVETCRSYNPQKANDGGVSTKTLILVTMREPIGRFVSYVHQLCNKNLDRRDERTLQACKRCDYYNDTDFWTGLCDEQNDLYKRISNDLLRSGNFGSAQHNEEMMVLDLLDLKPFLEKVQQSFPQVTISSQVNSESLENCNFHLVSPVIKSLTDSTDVYRNLW